MEIQSQKSPPRNAKGNRKGKSQNKDRKIETDGHLFGEDGSYPFMTGNDGADCTKGERDVEVQQVSVSLRSIVKTHIPVNTRCVSQ